MPHGSNRQSSIEMPLKTLSPLTLKNSKRPFFLWMMGPKIEKIAAARKERIAINRAFDCDSCSHIILQHYLLTEDSSLPFFLEYMSGSLELRRSNFRTFSCGGPWILHRLLQKTERPPLRAALRAPPNARLLGGHFVKLSC